ncbi:hypothetical protein SAMN04489724_1209 [Algoriphagus locisalis]|uniref:DUF5034 domain-containing protein n=1 Tax=Algoriphagus locisalis TaxID=305507 RepID=A0A1I6YTK1_9BACT|nr:hypothetical protein [Algoriphagus locisalis]SFT53737.1 hypothetical protein SAMN04489724_1209 [Algoriphagus locisalis]
MKHVLSSKRVKLTIAISSAYLSMMILVACVDDSEMNPFGECGGPQKVNATDVSLFYEPFTNNQYATESDTVDLEDFIIYLRIGSEIVSDRSIGRNNFPGRAYALSCAPNLDFQNIASITMTLLAPYGGKDAGTTISNLVTTHDDIKLSDLRDFNGSTGLYRLTLDLEPEDNSQLKTKTVLKFKNGTEKIFESISPVLLTN